MFVKWERKAFLSIIYNVSVLPLAKKARNSVSDLKSKSSRNDKQPDHKHYFFVEDQNSQVFIPPLAAPPASHVEQS